MSADAKTTETNCTRPTIADFPQLSAEIAKFMNAAFLYLRKQKEFQNAAVEKQADMLVSYVNAGLDEAASEAAEIALLEKQTEIPDNETELSENQLYECNDCSRKPGSPLLCDLCLLNRKLARVMWRGPLLK